VNIFVVRGVGCNEKVLWFQVAMHKVQLVKVLHSVQYLLCNLLKINIALDDMIVMILIVMILIDWVEMSWNELVIGVFDWLILSWVELMFEDVVIEQIVLR